MKQKNIRWINGICILALVMVVLPLLILGFYDYPTADDWSLGLWTHEAVVNGEGILGVMKAAIRTVLYWREVGEARYANAFLGSLQPGILGERFYAVTPWLMIGSLIGSELTLGGRFLKRGSRKWLGMIVVPSLCMQILCVPYPTETFYWYVGAVNYTFVFSLSLVLLYIYLRLSDSKIGEKSIVLLETLGILGAVLVGGDSYSASLSSACLFTCLSVRLLFKDKKAFFRTLPLTIITITGLILCVIAPANQVRLDKEFGGTVTYGVLEAIGMSLVRTFTNIYSWTTWKIVFLILLICPFFVLAWKNSEYRFSKPLLFTLFTFGIYASQITANMYVEGGISACRIADILYYGYHVWLLLNVGYWCGWITKHRIWERNAKIQSAAFWVRNHLTTYFMVVGAGLLLVFGATELRQSSTWRACVWLAKGYAQEYGEAWQERLAVLNDDSVTEAYFDPLTQPGEMVFYADLKQGNAWINIICAEYYGKEVVGLR